MSPPACGSKPVSAERNATRSTLLESAACAHAANARANASAAAAARCFIPLLLRWSSSLKQRLDVLREARGLGVRRITFDDVAVLVDKELREVPFDRFGAENAGLRLLQVLIQRRGVLAV